MPTPAQPGPPPGPEVLLAEYLARVAAGSAPDFEDLCRAHPGQAKALRELLAQYERVRAALRAGGAVDSPSFSARLKGKYGEGVDPEISLEPGPGTAGHAPEVTPTLTSTPQASVHTDELVRRLKDHSLGQSRYRLEGELARGGMGAILRVWDEDLRRHLAMKVIVGRGDAQRTGATPSVEPHQLARFLEEAQVTGQLDHPGIVPVHELGLDSAGNVYFTMKLVKGRDLKTVFDLLAEGKEGWNDTRALGVLLKACEAVAYAHSKGVIHRDLKPANVMVGNFGEVYVMDWGLARVLGRKETHDIRITPEFSSEMKSVRTERRTEREEAAGSPIGTMDGEVMGTPAYMAVEQARGEIEKLGPRTDVYAMGAMLYHLLARRAPYVDPAMRVSNHTVLAMVLHGPPEPLSSLRKDLPAELIAICQKAMARDPAQRYADTLALAEDLRAFLEHRVVRAYDSGAWAEARKWVERNKPLAASIAAALVVIVGGLTVFLTTLQSKNSALSLATAAAQKSESEARVQEGLAKTNSALAEEHRIAAEASEKHARDQEALAKAAEKEARAEQANVLRLSAFQTLDDLRKEAEKLWPAEPAMVPRYQEWMKKADALVAQLPVFRATLAELEQRALPQSEEEAAAALEAEHATYPRPAQLDADIARLGWMNRMLGEEPWPSEVDVEAELAIDLSASNGDAARKPLAVDVQALYTLATGLVSPGRSEYGSEMRGLLLARLAVAAAGPVELAACRSTLAWAYFSLGRFDEAIAQAQQAREECDPTERAGYENQLKSLRVFCNQWRDPDGRSSQTRMLEAENRRVAQRLERSIEAAEAALESEIAAAAIRRREWRFAGDATGGETRDRWWHDQMAKLILELEAFANANAGLMRGTSREFGWGVARRLEFASSVEAKSVGDPKVAQLWAGAIDAIAASPRYRETFGKSGARLTPQVGLLPLGADPASGLWEFAHLATGAPAARGADGRLQVAEGTGLVFVLLPGGTFWMGAQSKQKSGQNYDPQAEPFESPVHEVTLSPCFLSKFEMTQGQWLRFTGQNQSAYAQTESIDGWRYDLTHPVERVSANLCMAILARLGLELPTEAQWEYACRAGTETAWWSGAERESLRGHVNLADQTAAKAGSQWLAVQDWPDLVDGWNVHAPVGSLAANAFGLQEMCDNVAEWCRDSAVQYPLGKQLDPLTVVSGSKWFICRGGGFDTAASRARSASRSYFLPETAPIGVGVRPALRVTP